MGARAQSKVDSPLLGDYETYTASYTRSRLWNCEHSQGTVLVTEILLGQEFEFVRQPPKFWTISDSVIGGEDHQRSQERVSFRQSCVQPAESRACFTEAEISPYNGHSWHIALLAPNLQLLDYVAGFEGVSQQSGKVAEIAFANRTMRLPMPEWLIRT
jgi:hypothetical protein